MKFLSFSSVVIGMSLIGFSVGFILGAWLQMKTANSNWAYLSSVVLGIGSGLVIFGALARKKYD